MNEIVSLQIATWFHAGPLASADFGHRLAKSAFAWSEAQKISTLAF
ncbi:hypothetical protein GGQ88_001585 [Novosphingobium hassiacum]|uniref:Uncharacterized protein n=1 Tax=Novosphingobium hassiacum TaxID=173676 RepID=A0A7W5ZW42_9SPHN|nr:hypothetical protein [Novosphingobium hassiacum]MBB3860319.1 hypothetical protein [Novosphingobium hassiacum]